MIRTKKLSNDSGCNIAREREIIILAVNPSTATFTWTLSWIRECDSRPRPNSGPAGPLMRVVPTPGQQARLENERKRPRGNVIYCQSSCEEVQTFSGSQHGDFS